MMWGRMFLQLSLVTGLVVECNGTLEVVCAVKIVGEVMGDTLMAGNQN